jgi:hypothetical protein
MTADCVEDLDDGQSVHHTRGQVEFAEGKPLGRVLVLLVHRSVSEKAGGCTAGTGG